MKKKIGTILEDDILRRAKHKAAEEGRALSDIIQDALESYLSAAHSDPAKRDAAYRMFCDQPMRLTESQFQAVLEADAWDL